MTFGTLSITCAFPTSTCAISVASIATSVIEIELQSVLCPAGNLVELAYQRIHWNSKVQFNLKVYRGGFKEIVNDVGKGSVAIATHRSFSRSLEFAYSKK